EGHFLLGIALTGLGRYDRACGAYRAALSLNPNYRQAHLRLARLLKLRPGDPDRAAEHLRLFPELRSGSLTGETAAPAAPVATPAILSAIRADGHPTLDPEEVVIVSGLPRSGTSMLMQMLVAGGLPALTDGVREADSDNPRGYFEHEA